MKNDRPTSEQLMPADPYDRYDGPIFGLGLIVALVGIGYAVCQLYLF